MRVLFLAAASLALLAFLSPASWGQDGASLTGPAGQDPAGGPPDDAIVILHTGSGDIAIELFPGDAPGHVENFVSLAGGGFYDETLFHRVIEGFMIQGGDPNTRAGEQTGATQWGTGGPGYMIDAEFNTMQHDRGMVSMARSASPDSAGSQFFIVHQDSNFLDLQYTVFGRIITQESYDTLDAIATLDTIPDGTVPLALDRARILSAEIVDRAGLGDVLELGEPERLEPGEPALPEAPEGGAYTHEGLGVTFDAPEGWFLQEPPKTSPAVPDLVMIGPQAGGYNPAITIAADPRNGTTLADKILEADGQRQEAIDSGRLVFTSEDEAKINGLEAVRRSATGIFVIDGQPTDIAFAEVMLATPERFYTLTYSHEAGLFDDTLGQFDGVLDSFSADLGGQTEGTGGELAAGDLATGDLAILFGVAIAFVTVIILYIKRDAIRPKKTTHDGSDEPQGNNDHEEPRPDGSGQAAGEEPTKIR